MAKINRPKGTPIELAAIRKRLREVVIDKYGSIPKFLRTDEGIKLGGMRIKPCFYDKGTVSISVLNNLCQYFGIGELTRKVHIIRTVDYFLNTPI